MIRKYPRTRHLEGSRLQIGDHDLDAVPLSELSGGAVVIEEKLDGANAAVSFEDGELRLQSRGHYLVGGPREKHFDLFKQWAHTHRARFLERLGERYVMYGEWLYAKHTVYYDALPHWFMEFDVFDRGRGLFLATKERRALLDGLPIASVPVLFEGPCPSGKSLTALVRRSLYKSEGWRALGCGGACSRARPGYRPTRDRPIRRCGGPIREARIRRRRDRTLQMGSLHVPHERHRIRNALAKTSDPSEPTLRLRRHLRRCLMIAELCPAPDQWQVRWDEIRQRLEWIDALYATPQDAIFHAEGDVGIHTRMALEALAEMPEFRALAAEDRAIVFSAVLLHDIGKIAATRVESNGRVSSRGHSAISESETRVALWREGVPLASRESVAALVRNHQLPFFLVDRPDARRLAIGVSQTTRCDLLALVAEADARGRRCANPDDQKRILDNVALFVEYCREQGCLERPWAFASDHSRFLWFRKPERDPEYCAHDDTRCEVTLLSGLPGAGKNTWLARNGAQEIIALDAIRDELEIDPEDSQGPVIQAARERARTYLRKGQSFVWNATNISRRLRTGLIAFLADYGARIRIVYVEVSEPELRHRNQQREKKLPWPVIENLLEKWSVPDRTEAHQVEMPETS